MSFRGQVVLTFGALAVLLGLFGWSMALGDRLDARYEEHGVVEKVTSCYVQKYHNTCKITLYNNRTMTTDFTNYPGDVLTQGDRVGRMLIMYEHGEQTWICRNDRCRMSSYCMGWMSCFSEDDEIWRQELLSRR